MRDVRVLLVVVAVVAAACQDKPSAATSDPAAHGKPPAPAPVPVRPPPSGPPPAAPSPAPATSDKPIGADLVAQAGAKPVLIALDAKGQVIARTADGGFSRVLLVGPYGDGQLDGARALLWLRGDHALDVLDLRGKALAATTVVTFPDKAMEKLGRHIKEPPTWKMDAAVNVLLDTPCSKGAGLQLEWAKNGESAADWAKGFRAVGKDWFAAQASREAHELPAEPSAAKTKRKVPASVGTCADDAKEAYGKRHCGTGVAFGATGRELVVVGASSERCPDAQCQLYDPRTKKLTPVPAFAADDGAAPSCGPWLFDAGGQAFVAGDQVCGPDLACSSVGLLAIGWLGSDRTVETH